MLVQVAFCAIMFISFVHLVPEKEALAIRLFFFSLIVHQWLAKNSLTKPARMQFPDFVTCVDLFKKKQP